jgi:hypothetical protein
MIRRVTVDRRSKRDPFEFADRFDSRHFQTNSQHKATPLGTPNKARRLGPINWLAKDIAGLPLWTPVLILVA